MAICIVCGDERHRGSCSDPIPLDDDDLSRPINQDDECTQCGAPLGEDDEGSNICFDCYNDKRIELSDSVSSEECGYCGSGTDPEIMCSDCWAEMRESAS